MLSSGANPLQTSFSNPKQIVASSYVTSTIMYTVPSGKKFIGYIWSSGTFGSAAVTTSLGASVSFAPPSAVSAPGAMLITLVAGTIITNNSTNQIQIIGVETDA